MENQNQPEVEEVTTNDNAQEVTSTTNVVEKVKNNYDKYAKEVKDDSEGFAKKTITETLAKYEEEIKKLLDEKKFKYFAKSKKIKAQSVEELSPEEKAEYEKYQLSQEDKDNICSGLYNEAKKEVKQINDDRHGRLKTLGENIDRLKDETEKLYTKKISERDKLDKDPKKNAKALEEIDKEIATLKAVKDGIGTGEKGDKSLLSEYKAITSTQKDVRVHTYDRLVNTFGQNLPSKDEDFIKGIEKEKQPINNEVEEKKDNKDKEVKDQNKEEKDGAKKGAIPADMAAKLAQQMANAGVQPQQEGVAQEEQVVENKADLAKLGYNGDVLNAKSSRALLDAFVALDDNAKLEYLKDADAQSKIFEAMKKANNRWSPVAAIKFNKTRRELLKMANGPMMRKALESIGADVDYKNLDKLEENFNNVVKNYEKNRIQKQTQIDKMPDGEEKDKLRSELAALDKEYSAIAGVKEFRNISNQELNRFRDRVVDKMSGMFNRNDQDTVKLSAPSSNLEQPQPDIVKNSQSAEKNNFTRSLGENVVSVNEMINRDISDLKGTKIKGARTISKNGPSK